MLCRIMDDKSIKWLPTFTRLKQLRNQIDMSTLMAYYNSSRTSRTSHASDVSHGETFFYTEKDELDIERTKDF